MSLRDDLLRQALGATFQGDKSSARRLLQQMLTLDPKDVAALEGLRRLDAPSPADSLAAPAPPVSSPTFPATPPASATEPPARVRDHAPSLLRSESADLSTPPRRESPPGALARPAAAHDAAERPHPAPAPAERKRRNWWWLLLLLLLVPFLKCDRNTSPSTDGGLSVFRPLTKAPAADPQAAAPPPDLAAAGTIQPAGSRKEWVLTPPYKITPSYAVSAVRSVLKANPGVDKASIGGTSAERNGEALSVKGADLAQITEEGRLVLASAVWRYTEQNGRVPKSLGELLPQYLDEIPLEAVSGKAKESPQRDGSGGWVYAPAGGGGDLWSGIASGLQPNVGSTPTRSDETFTPITVAVHKSSRTLEVYSGTRKLRSYKVGVGAADTTPEGQFRIDQRSALAEKLPDGRPNPFGTRWLRLTVGNNNEAFGIHGTDQPASVGAALSRGCLRLERGDLEDLYQLLPTGTPVTIDNL